DRSAVEAACNIAWTELLGLVEAITTLSARAGSGRRIRANFFLERPENQHDQFSGAAARIGQGVCQPRRSTEAHPIRATQACDANDRTDELLASDALAHHGRSDRGLVDAGQ